MKRSCQQKRRPSPVRAAGFSLLEMLVAAVVLAVGLVIVTESISAGLTAAARTERRLVASRLAADRLDRLAVQAEPALPAEGGVTTAGVEYRWHVQQLDEVEGMRHLLCTVRWTVRGRQRTASMEQFVPAQQAEAPGP